MTTKMTKLVDLMIDFIWNTIQVYESSLYKGIALKGTDFSKIKDQSCNIYLINFNVHYFNSAYSSLIKNDDEFITAKFKEMCGVLKTHTSLCILNVLFRMTTEIITSYERSKLDTSTHDNYMRCVKRALIDRRGILTAELPRCFDHVCEDVDLDDCDPDEPLFYMGTKPA